MTKRRTEWLTKPDSKVRWKEEKDPSNRMRYEMSSPMYFFFENSDRAKYSEGYDAIDWSDGAECSICGSYVHDASRCPRKAE